MLTRLRIRNFKRFDDVEVELGSPVVFVGPNNSGKTTALQALALWDVGLKRWIEKRSGKVAPRERPGVTVNRRDLLASPVPSADLLWRGLHTRDVRRVDGKRDTKNVLIRIDVEGVLDGRSWEYGLEFYYANPESFYCRPAGTTVGQPPEDVPAGAAVTRLAYLPPMSGLLANETLVSRGAVNVRLGEGRTAEVLRNLCFEVVNQGLGWQKLYDPIRQLFGVELDQPRFIEERGEISMTYRESGVSFDLSSAGRGLQQTLLLLAHLTVNPGSVLLLDEPDAHLETLRQRQTYQLLVDTARESGSQIIAASHSEVVLNEAADRDVVIAFLGRPHRIDDRGNQLLKALREIGFEHYQQAEQRGWVLYLEGSTDLAILREWARILGHDRAGAALERPFVHYVGNDRQKAVSHFYGLRAAKRDLTGIAVFDRDREAPVQEHLNIHVWARREIESYLCTRETLVDWARHAGGGRQMPLFAAEWGQVMEAVIGEIEQALNTLGRPSPWEGELKVSDDFLDPVFQKFYDRLGLENLMRKSNYHELARFVPRDQIDPEIRAVLDRIAETCSRASPAGEL
jgi:ABC-type taurine transport system ATPase subunit